MFSLFKKDKISIDLIEIPTFGFQQISSKRDIKLWNDNNSRELSLHFFKKKPDLPFLDKENLITFFRNQVSTNNGAIIEIESFKINDFDIVKTILKFNIGNNELGLNQIVYLGSLIIPFKNYSFVIKINSFDEGVTGIRESIIFNDLLVEKDGDLFLVQESWSKDPYDSEFKSDFLMNTSELEIYDEKFDEHPLTLIRNKLKMIEKEIKFDHELKNIEKFQI